MAVRRHERGVRTAGGVPAVRPEPARRRRRARLGEQPLDEAVLEGLVGLDDDAAVDAHSVEGLRQGTFECGEFAVDLDAERLEHALRGMARIAFRRGRRGLQDLDEASRRGDPLVGSLAHDARRVPGRELLVAAAVEQFAQRGLVVVVHDVFGGDAARAIHAHVERCVPGVGEAALGLVELERGDPEVEQHGVDLAEAEFVERFREAVVDGVHERHAVAEARESTSRELERIGVAIDAHEAGGGARGEHGLGVAAHAEGRVDVDGPLAVEGGSEELDATSEHDGGVECGGVA